MGKEMENGGKSGTNWKITKNIKEFHHLLYGDSKFRSQGDNKQAKTRTNTMESTNEDEEEDNLLSV